MNFGNPDLINEVSDKIIFALDVPGRKDAIRYVKMLDGLVGCFKVGLELFISEGPKILQAVNENSSAGIFLDLKLHDIPATVSGALQSANRHQVRFITVHGDTQDSFPKIQGSHSGPEILAVTVLTSLAQKDLKGMGFGADLTLERLALRRAEMARKAGCAGVVCSGGEVAAIKETCGSGFKVIVPGIRPAWTRVSGDDQARIVTPQFATAAGADFIVVGRPIRDASNPQDAAKKIAEEIQSTWMAKNKG